MVKLGGVMFASKRVTRAGGIPREGDTGGNSLVKILYVGESGQLLAPR